MYKNRTFFPNLFTFFKSVASRQKVQTTAENILHSLTPRNNMGTSCKKISWHPELLPLFHSLYSPLNSAKLNCSSEVTLMWITKIMEHAKLALLGKTQFYKMLQIYSCKCITANEVIMMGARVGSWKDCNLEWRMDGNCAFLPIFGACFSPWVAAQSSAGTNKRKYFIWTRMQAFWFHSEWGLFF